MICCVIKVGDSLNRDPISEPREQPPEYYTVVFPRLGPEVQVLLVLNYRANVPTGTWQTDTCSETTCWFRFCKKLKPDAEGVTQHSPG